MSDDFPRPTSARHHDVEYPDAEEILESDLYRIFRDAKRHQIVAAIAAARRYSEYWAGSTPRRQAIQ